jgi:DNA-binding MarR family transcriptional regulator
MTPVEQRLFALLTEVGITAHLVSTRFDRASPGGLNAAQFGVLNHFARLDKAAESPSRLARAFQVTKGNMTNTLQRLEARGFVTVEPDPADARAKIVRPTPEGRAARDAALAEVLPDYRRLFGDFPDADVEAAYPVLRRLRLILDDAPDR